MSYVEMAGFIFFFWSMPAMSWGVVYSEKAPFIVNAMTFTVLMFPWLVCLIVLVIDMFLRFGV